MNPREALDKMGYEANKNNIDRALREFKSHVTSMAKQNWSNCGPPTKYGWYEELELYHENKYVRDEVYHYLNNLGLKLQYTRFENIGNPRYKHRYEGVRIENK